MKQSEVHQVFLRAAIECADNGASAKELANYLEIAAKAMRANAAFCLSGEQLAYCLREESA